MANEMPKIAIITMVQKQDLPWAYASLSSIGQLTFPSLLRLVLVNDTCDEELESRLAAAGGAEIIAAGQNLGVAGGRNRLVREAAARGADYVLSVDDDILLPTDFVEILWANYQRIGAEGGQAGIFTPATLDFHGVASACFGPGEITQISEGKLAPKKTTHQYRVAMSATEEFTAEHIYHMGIRDWRGTYLFSNAPQDFELQRMFGVAPVTHYGIHADLKSATGSVDAVLKGAPPIKIDTAPGGICFYSIKLFDTVGGVSEAFNPFGYEDADFAIRARNAGFQHYCAPEALAIHDIALRLSKRRLPVLLATRGKMAGAFVRKHLPPREGAAAMYSITRRAVIGLGQKEKSARDHQEEFTSINRLAALAAYFGNAFLFLLPNKPWQKAPTSEQCLLSLEKLLSAAFADSAHFKTEKSGDALRITASGSSAPFFHAIVCSGNEATTINIEKLAFSPPREFIPPLGKVIFGEGQRSSVMKAVICLAENGEFRIDGFELQISGGAYVRLSGKGRRAKAPMASAAPLVFDAIEFELEDHGMLPRLLTFCALVEQCAPKVLYRAIKSAYATIENIPLFEWLAGERKILRGKFSGVLDGVPQALQFNVEFHESPLGVANLPVKNLYRTRFSALLEMGGGGDLKMMYSNTKIRAKGAFNMVKRLSAPDPRVAPFPDAYNPNYVTKMAQKMRYIAASRGLALAPNEARINGFKGSGKGKRAFIIGNGPSLNKIDLSKLSNEITFGVNAIYLNKEKMGFLPTHYVVEDVFVAEDRAGEINALTGPTKWFGNYLRYCLEGGSDVCWMNVACDYRNYPDFPHFSTNASRLVWVGGTVSYIAMQLAFFMGFDQVYLVGFDHSYSVPKEAVVEGAAITSTSDDPNHFHPDYFGKGYRWHDPRVDRMEQAYHKVERCYVAAGRNIYNATAGGELEVFERVDYNSLFKA